MSNILNTVRDVDPNNSDAVKDALTAFFQNLSKHERIDCNKWLRSLESVINRFPKYCISHRNTIEVYLLKFLDSNNYYNVIQAAKCIHVLQQVRPSQEKGVTAKTCWREQMNILCDAVHKLISDIFPDAVDVYKNNEEVPKQQSHSLADTPFAEALKDINIVPTQRQNNIENKSELLYTRLRNMFVCIQAMLVEIYPVAKLIRPQTILDVIVRSLNVSSGKISKIIHSSSNITVMKIQTLRTLDALVACMGPHLIPFSPLVIKSVMQTLRWSSKCSSEDSKKVRCAAYSSMAKWLTVLHVHRPVVNGNEHRWEDELAEQIIGDITPPRRVVQLTTSSLPTKNISKKAKRRLANTMLRESSMAAHMPGEKNSNADTEEVTDEVALAALDCAETYLTVCGTFLKPTTYKKFQECLVRECYNLDAYTNDRALSLIRILEVSRKTTPPTMPPPTQYCLQLYSVLINSRHEEISKLCSRALLDIRLHLHCSPPSLNFALEVQQEKRSAEMKRKKISDKNKTVLESLLGTDKMPPEDISDEEITQEPSNKKVCFQEEIVDQISLSSDSDQELELIIEEMHDDEVIEEIIIEPTIIFDNAEPDKETDEDIESNVKVTENIALNVAEKTNENTESNAVEEIYESTKSNVAEESNEDTISKIAEENNKNTESNITKETNENTGTNVTKETNIKEANENNKSDVIEESKIERGNENNKSNIVKKTNEANTLQDETTNIYEAPTQIILDSSDEIEEQSPKSMEVTYDYPNTGTDKVTVLEKMEDENLPSTNDTEDIQITCGQDIKNSQEVNSQKTKLNAEPKSNEEPVVNGTNTIIEVEIVNDSSVNEGNSEHDVSIKLPAENKDVSVIDMMADFVDEVAEENVAEA